MEYVAPCVDQSESILRPFNPLNGGLSRSNINLVSDAIALGPTRVMGDFEAGYADYASTGLDGVGEWRDALDVFSAVNFLFP